MLVTLPFVLLLLDYWPLGRWRPAQPGRRAAFGRLTVEKLPLLALAGVFCVLATVAQGKAGALSSLEALPLESRLKNAVLSYGAYLLRTVYPVHLAAYYPAVAQAVPVWEVGVVLGALLAVSAVAVWQARRAPWVAVGWLWFLGTLVPVIGLVQVGSHAQADRYVYVPLVGLFIAASWSLAHLALYPRWHKPAIALACLSVACLVPLSWQQAHAWTDTEALWQHALTATRDNHVAHNNLAVELQKRGDLAGALREFGEALRIKPGYAHALNGKGQSLMSLDKVAEAAECFREAVRSDPTLTMSHNNLGVALARMGKPAEAAEEFAEVVRLDPEDASGHLNLGRALLGQGKAAEAIPHFRGGMRLKRDDLSALPELGRACQLSRDWAQAETCFRRLVALQPGMASYHRELASCLSRRGQASEAAAQYQQSLRLDPKWPSACLAKAWVQATHPDPAVRRGPTALLLAQQVVEATGQPDAQALDTLACAYAEAGRFPEALQAGSRARDRARAAGQTALAHEIEDRLRLYEKGQPFHMPVPSAPPSGQ
jgi:tetratricopeptide (TPR) repeat protein